MAGAARQARAMAENARKLEAEKAEREARENGGRLAANAQAEAREGREAGKREAAAALAGEALSEAGAPPRRDELTYALLFSGRAEDLLHVRRAMTERGVAYEKLEEFITGGGEPAYRKPKQGGRT